MLLKKFLLWKSSPIWLSVLAHGILAGMLFVEEKKEVAPPEPVKIRITEPPPKPKKFPEKRKPNHDIKKLTRTPKKVPPPKKEVQPVQGLTKESFATEGAKVSAPAGNTTMTEDKGIRLSPDQIAELPDDLSADPKLITESINKPTYTEAALDAELEGVFKIDVYVTDEGTVQKAELSQKIGYGMDDRVIMMAMQAKFIPRKDPLGQPVGGWTQIAVKLDVE